jgi:hypothetical protein
MLPQLTLPLLWQKKEKYNSLQDELSKFLNQRWKEE